MSSQLTVNASHSGVRVTAAALEAIKWVGLILMVVDHINKFLFNGFNGTAFAWGRLAMPCFVFVLAYKLALADESAYKRVMLRCVAFGFIALVPLYLMGGATRAIYPLNMLFTVCVLTMVLALLRRGQWFSAACVFALGGCVVEFWWPALALGVAVWWFARMPGWWPCVVGLASLLALEPINRNGWALAAIPLVVLLVVLFGGAKDGDGRYRSSMARWFFYAFYPGHLLILALVRIPMRQAGYLFFF